MKIWISILCVFGAIVLAQSRRRVIIDADIGVDDAHALVILLNADLDKIIKIEAVVCSLGNTDLEYTCENMIKVLESAGRLDIPIYKGAFHPLVSEYEKPTWDGVDGFGDLEFKNQPNMSIIRKENPTKALNELVNKYPGEITMILLGGLTNAALPMRTYDDYSGKIFEVYMMGGNYNHSHSTNYTVEPEFNFLVDPEATFIIFENARWINDGKITLIPAEVCLDTNTSLGWRFDVLGKVDNPICNLLTRVDDSISGHKGPDAVWVPYDAFLAMAFLYPEAATIRSHEATINLKKPLRGELVITANEGPVKVIDSFDEEVFRRVMLDACTNVCRHNRCKDVY